MQRRPGQPRSERDAAFLQRFDARMRLPIIVSAILPLIVAPESHGWVGAVVGITTWLVFLLDYMVHVRHLEHYGRTGFGRFDLFVVIATAPWFLIPGAQAGGFVVLLRLARLARLAMATKGSRRLFDRLGRIAVVAGGVLVTGSLVAYYAEHPANPGFATVGDALWWGIVTLTTVGYGDIVPHDPGRAVRGRRHHDHRGRRPGAARGRPGELLPAGWGRHGCRVTSRRASRHRGHVHRRRACGPGRRGVSPAPTGGGPDRAVDRTSPDLT